MRSPTLELEPLLWFQFLEGKRLRRVGRLEEKGGGGQRVLLLSKPLFSILDHLFHRQEGHSLFPFSSLWKGFSLPCVSLCPVCIRLKSNSLNPNQFLLAIQQRSFHEWPGGSKGQKSTFLFACLSLNTKPGGLRPNQSSFSSTVPRGRWKKTLTFWKSSCTKGTPHPMSNHRLLPAVIPKLNSSQDITQVCDGSCTLTKKKPSPSTFQN